ncbi:ead/Ea22-like family protein [Cronobacter sakazakii]|uniref:ead/Ea22-like family protein n=1 Tax=Cronobacter sakazakii TaxID=28141 RepID=UPI000CFD252B|nr:ead/Ea22-like family protein [Cronobacter sakazakii]
MNRAKLKALRERYSPQPAPKCHICGAEMTVQRMSASRITYGCTGAIYDDAGCRYAAGRDIADAHYEQSRVTVVDVSDPDVLELIAALEAAKKTSAARLEAIDRTHKMYQRENERAESAEKRIAELEARTVKLPSINPQMFNDDVMFGYRKAQREAVEFCAAAGINLETGGE